ncbi:MAG: hypothetical protein M3314_06865 [Actinomycetota bacterium]|nr:hypothetical protein [Actinomycetota bacterium]
MSDLYRRLLSDITARFGGTLDDANADAIAYAAAELYHRDFEPRLWEEKSAHDLLDLFGIPRAGVFAPYSLSDRLLLFQRRSSQAQYVTRAHEVLSALGVPRHDEAGAEQSLKWRLERVLASVNGESPDGADDSEDELADDAAVGNEERDKREEGGDANPEAKGGREAGSDAPDAGRGKDQEKTEPDGDASAGDGNGQVDEPEAIGFAPLVEEPEDGSSTLAGSGRSSTAEPSPAQLVDAVRALEQAAEMEADLASHPGAANGGAGVDVASLADTLSGIQAEIAALRDLVEAFELGVRRQFDELQNRLISAGQGPAASLAPSDSSEPVPLIPRPVDPTHEMAPVSVEQGPLSSLTGGGDGEGGFARRSGRRVLLVILLAVLGVLIAGGIAVAVALGWDTIRPEPAGLLRPLGGGLQP